MFIAQFNGILIDAALAADGIPPGLTDGPYAWIGGIVVFLVSAFLFVRNSLQQLRSPSASETNVYMGGPIDYALKSLDAIRDKMDELPPGERRMIELRDHFALAVETTRRNFYTHCDKLEERLRETEQKIAGLEAQVRQRRIN